MTNDERMNKSEIRNPKSEARGLACFPGTPGDFGFRYSGFFRISDLGLGISLVLALAAFFQGPGLSAAEPLRALLITGGCCHDYEAQKKILTEGISARANVAWTILHEGLGDAKDHKFSIYEKPDWAKGFDIVVHNECSGKVTNVTWVEHIAKAHFDGVPAVVIHCSIHSYRNSTTDEWRKLLGVSSYRHQQRRTFDV